MNELVNEICGGATEFTPQAIIGIIVFMLIFEGLMGIVALMIKGVKR